MNVFVYFIISLLELFFFSATVRSSARTSKYDIPNSAIPVDLKAFQIVETQASSNSTGMRFTNAPEETERAQYLVSYIFFPNDEYHKCRKKADINKQ